MKDFYLFTDFETNGLNITNGDVPIEIGMLLTDDKYNIIDLDSFYISSFDQNKTMWNAEELGAYKVHKIPFEIVQEQGINAFQAVKHITNLLENCKDQEARIIIVSDNGQFEYNTMKTLYQLAKQEDKFPFHYAAWDINILINSVGISKGESSHIALQDMFRTYKAVIRALEHTEYKWEQV